MGTNDFGGLIRALAGLSPLSFSIAACILVIALTVAAEVALKLAGVSDSQALSILAPTVPLVSILVVNLRSVALLEARRAEEQADLQRRVEHVIATADSIRDVIKLIQGPPGSGPDPRKEARWRLVAGVLEDHARSTGDPTDVESARAMTRLYHEYFGPAVPPPPESPAEEARP